MKWNCWRCFGLAEAAEIPDIVQAVQGRLAASWVRVSRFRDVLAVTDRSRRIQTSAAPLLWAGQAKQDVGDRAGEAATLNNIGGVYDVRGDGDTALDHYRQALPILREIGDRAGEAVTRYNIAIVHRDAVRLADAVPELEVVVELDRAIQHPDLAADTAVLAEIRAQLLSQGSSGAGE